MANKTISEFSPAAAMGDSDLLLVSQGGNTKNIAGSVIKAFVRAAAEAQAESTADDAVGVALDDLTVSFQEIAAGGTSSIVKSQSDGIYNLLFKIAKANGITSISKTGTSGAVDTYTITYADGSTSTFTITNGIDGFTPTVALSTITGGHRLTITNRNGTTTADVTDGEDGVSPTITVSDITGGHRLTIHNADGTTNNVDVLNGVDGQGAGDMLKSVYDPQNKNQDSFAYADGKVSAHNSSSSAHSSLFTAKINTSVMETTLSPASNANIPTSKAVADYVDDHAPVSFSVTLTVAGWSGGTQTVSDARFLSSGCGYIVSPNAGSHESYAEAMIRANTVTTAGQMVFSCSDAPTEAITVNIMRVEVSA